LFSKSPSIPLYKGEASYQAILPLQKHHSKRTANGITIFLKKYTPTGIKNKVKK
jgi:hypothetical protein